MKPLDIKGFFVILYSIICSQLCRYHCDKTVFFLNGILGNKCMFLAQNIFYLEEILSYTLINEMFFSLIKSHDTLIVSLDK